MPPDAMSALESGQAHPARSRLQPPGRARRQAGSNALAVVVIFDPRYPEPLVLATNLTA